MSAALRTVVGARTSDFDRLVALAAEDGKDCYRPGWRFTGSASFARLKSLPDAVFRSTLLQALHARLLKRTPHAEASVPTPTPHEIARVLGACLAHFARTAAEWELEQVTAVLEATAPLPFDSYTNVDEYRFAIGLAEQRNRVSPLPANSVVALVELRENLTRQGDVAMSGGTSNDVNSLNARLLALIPAGDDVFGGIALAESDPFGKAATVALRSLVGTDGLGTALAHLVRPPGSGAWKAEVRRRADILGALARTLIGLLATTELSSSWMLAASSVALVKGAAATLAEIGGSDDAALLEQAVVATAFLAQGLYAAGAPPRACIGALGQMSVSEGHEGLVRMRRAVVVDADVAVVVAVGDDARNRMHRHLPGMNPQLMKLMTNWATCCLTKIRKISSVCQPMPLALSDKLLTNRLDTSRPTTNPMQRKAMTKSERNRTIVRVAVAVADVEAVAVAVAATMRLKVVTVTPRAQRVRRQLRLDDPWMKLKKTRAMI